MSKFLDTWQRWWKGGREAAEPAAEGEGKGLLGKDTGRNLAILAVLGAVLLLLGRGGSPEETAPTSGKAQAPAAAPSAVAGVAADTAVHDELARVLTMIAGAGRVDVYITFDNGPEQVIAEEVTVEKSNGRESRRPVTVRDDAARSERPIVLQQREPQVRGVVVVADGAADPEIRRTLAEAAATALGVPAYRISVFPRSR